MWQSPMPVALPWLNSLPRKGVPTVRPPIFCWPSWQTRLKSLDSRFIAFPLESATGTNRDGRIRLQIRRSHAGRWNTQAFSACAIISTPRRWWSTAPTSFSVPIRHRRKSRSSAFSPSRPPSSSSSRLRQQTAKRRSLSNTISRMLPPVPCSASPGSRRKPSRHQPPARTKGGRCDTSMWSGIFPRLR